MKCKLFMCPDPPWCGVNILRHAGRALRNGGPGKEKLLGDHGDQGGECRR